MIIVMQPKAAENSIHQVISYIEGNGLTAHLSQGFEVTIIGVVGDKTRLNELNILGFDEVEKIIPVTESYKLVNLKFHPEETVVNAGKAVIGPKTFTVMAGPCAIESEEQLMKIAKGVAASGATMLRGGAYKPRTSPYSFQGLEEEGLRYMKEAGDETGLATITEVVDAKAVEAAVKYVDMLQVGSRNMQNFMLLREVGKSGKPVMLKRGLCATIDEWLNAAEYIMSEGNPNVVLCERGIRTYETATRNTLDISAIPVLRSKTHLPIIIDPSHSTGHTAYVPSMAKAAVAAGADGLMMEVHHDPAHALSDGAQSLTLPGFDSLMKTLKPYTDLEGRSLLNN